jgi:hypothetical protein
MQLPHPGFERIDEVHLRHRTEPSVRAHDAPEA